MVRYDVLALGDGLVEEFFNRGFLMNVLRSAFKSERIGFWCAATFSVLIFVLGHLPTSNIDWILIVVPTLIYTALFIVTHGLCAPIAAHAFHDGIVVLIHWFQYVG